MPGADFKAIVVPTLVAFAAVYIPGGTAALKTALWSAGITAATTFAANQQRKKAIKNAREAAAEASRRLVNFREPVPPREFVYGSVRKGGPILYATTNEQHLSYGEVASWLNLVIAFSATKIHSYAGFWINDDFIELLPPESPSGQRTTDDPKYARRIWITPFLGDDDQQASTVLESSSNGEWDMNARLQGIAYCVVNIRRDANLYPQGIPTITAQIRGKECLDIRNQSDTTPRWTNNPSLVMYDYYTFEEMGMGIDRAEIVDETFMAGANVADMRFDVNNGVGTDNYANTYTVETADTRKDRDGTKLFSSIHFNDLDRIYVGHPTNTSASGNIQGYAWSNGHSGVQVASSIDNARNGVFLTPPPPSGNVVRRTAEPQFTFNGVIDSTQKPNAVISSMLTAQGADHSFTNGFMNLLPDQVNPTPVGSLTLKDVVNDDIILNPKTTRKGRFNTVKGIYIDAAQGSQPVAYPEVSDDLAVAADGGRKIYNELPLENTASKTMASRLARGHLNENRREITLNVLTNLKSIRYSVGDVLNVRLDHLFGSTPKKFTIIQMTIEPIGGQGFAVRLGLKETVLSRVWRSTVDDDGMLSYHVINNLPTAFDVSAPTNLVLASGTDQLLEHRDGGVDSRILATWVSNSAFVDEWIIEWKKSSETWTEGESAIEPGDRRRFYINNVEDGTSYDVRVLGRTSLGVRSAYASVVNHNVVGKTAPPPDATMVNLQVNELRSGTRQVDGNDQGWEPDVRVGGGLLIKWSRDLAATWDNMTVLRGVFSALPWTFESLSPGSYRFAYKFVDSSGNESVNPVYLDNVVLGAQNLGDVFDELNEAGDDFAGTIRAGIKMAKNRNVNQIIRAPDSNSGWSSISPTPWNTNRSFDNLSRSDNSVSYKSPVKDFGAVRPFFATPNVDWSGGSLSMHLEYSNTVNGSGALVSPTRVALTDGTASTFITARYLTVEVVITHGHTGTTINNAVLRNIVLAFSSSTVSYTYSNLRTSGATGSVSGFTRTGTGRFNVQHLNGASEISKVDVDILGSQSALTDPHTARTVMKHPAVEATSSSARVPASVDIEIRDGNRAYVDALVDITLQGPQGQ